MIRYIKITTLLLLFVVCCSIDCFNRYKAKIISVYDGDTVTAEVDLGIQTKTIEKIRLYGIDAPEVRGSERPRGLISRDTLRSWVLNNSVVLQTIDDDDRGKYGRLLGVLYKDGVNLNKQLVKHNLAEEAYY